eukprot:355301-Chlamydomonas_euryale.AAC.9
MQGQRVKNGEQAWGVHQPNPTRPHRTTLHPVTLGSSHRRSSATISLWACKQLWKAECHQLTRLAGGCGRRRLHPRTKRQPRARTCPQGVDRIASSQEESESRIPGSCEARKGRAIPTGESEPTSKNN